MYLQRVLRRSKYLLGPIRVLIKPLRERYLQRPKAMQGALQGCRMRGYYSSYHEGSYELALTQILVRVVEPGWVCVDVGANRGHFTLLLCKLVGQNEHIIAFEAHPGNVEELKANIHLNPFDSRAKIENIAVSDGSCESIDLFPGREHRSEEWNIIGRDVEGKSTDAEMKIPATSLDGYFPPNSNIDFVKMDIEGSEVYALPGTGRLLRESRPLVLIEFHGQAGANSWERSTNCMMLNSRGG